MNLKTKDLKKHDYRKRTTSSKNREADHQYEVQNLTKAFKELSINEISKSDRNELKNFFDEENLESRGKKENRKKGRAVKKILNGSAKSSQFHIKIAKEQVENYNKLKKKNNKYYKRMSSKTKEAVKKSVKPHRKFIRDSKKNQN